QFIGMSGSGFKSGIAIATYEWISAIMLIIIAKWFLPVYVSKKVYTMPQFLEQRYDARVRTSLAVFWLVLYVFVNLTSVLYLGGLALQTVFGIPLEYAVYGLALISAIYTIYGGLTAVAWTDVIQVTVLIFGGFLTTFLALNAISDGHGPILGFTTMVNQAPEKFHLILSKDNPEFSNLPGIRTILTGLWITGMSYWGCSQYITQRALAARSMQEAQRGLLFAGYLKILMPFVVVLPGIAAFVLKADITKADQAYPWLVNTFIPVGIKGVALAALAGAIISALSSMVNAAGTIFTFDIYKKYFNQEASDQRMVSTGRISSFIAILIEVSIAPMLKNLDQAFQFIQEYTGFISPAIFALFFYGIFWKRTTSNAVLIAAGVSIPVSAFLKYLYPGLPFLDRIGVVFLILSAIIILVSLLESKKSHPGAIELKKELFRTDWVFNTLALGLIVILCLLYARFW
ncbi:MAG: sodium/solute symporter, partial [Chloroflexi bacterium]|nr:sodium/solute symporter [Chloroflexota bacterium]